MRQRMFDEVRLSSGGLKRVKRTSETVVKMDCISSPKGNVDYVYFDLLTNTTPKLVNGHSDD
jgi:hypothetical protein